MVTQAPVIPSQAALVQAWPSSAHTTGSFLHPWFGSQLSVVHGSWSSHAPAFVPVTFELCVLTASFCGLLAWLAVTRLPRLDHAVFAHPDFERASQDAFFVRVGCDDPRFDAVRTPELLRHCGGSAIVEVGA